MNIFYRTLQTIKSASFFCMATDSFNNGNTNNIKNNMKNQSIPKKILFSGLILGVNCALLGRAIYKKAKNFYHKKKNESKLKNYQCQNNQKQLQNDNNKINNKVKKDEAKKELVVPFIEKPYISHDIMENKIFGNNNIVNNNDNQFFNNKPLSDKQEMLLKNMKTFNVKENNKDFPNSFLLESNTSKSKINYVINLDGLFDKKHNLLLSNNSSLADLSIFVTNQLDVFQNDLCLIYSILKDN